MRQTGLGIPRHVVLDQEIPESLQTDVREPNVTAQLLDLEQTSMNVYSKGSKSVTEQTKGDILACVVSGRQQFALVSAWETSLMKSGHEFAEGGFLPKQFSPLDLFTEAILGVKVHEVTL